MGRSIFSQEGKKKIMKCCISEWLKLLRIKHYVKNILVFVPLFFFQNITWEYIGLTSLGFLSYSLAASGIYIFNDIQDIEKDRLHPKKRKRPLASGTIKVKSAFAVGVLLTVLSIGISVYLKAICALILGSYIAINILYSIKLKHVPLMDVLILALGYLIRIFYGAYITDIDISAFLYLTVLSGALFMGLGKRRGEMKKAEDIDSSRKVLKYYTYEFLDKNLYVQMTLSITFYSLWCLSFGDDPMLLFSVPVLIFVFLRYSLLLEGNSDGDPMDILESDYIMWGLILVLAVLVTVGIYF